MVLIVSSLLIVSGPAVGEPFIVDYEQKAECTNVNDGWAYAEGYIAVGTDDLLYDLTADATVWVGSESDSDHDEASGVHPVVTGDWEAHAEAELYGDDLPDGASVRSAASVEGRSVSPAGEGLIFQEERRRDPPAEDTCGSSTDTDNLPIPSTRTEVTLEVGTDCILDVRVEPGIFHIQCTPPPESPEEL